VTSDREGLERELASRLEEMAPSAAPNALRRASARIAATPQRGAWAARLASASGSFGWVGAGATGAVVAAALLVGIFIGQAASPRGIGDSPSIPASVPPASATPEPGIEWEEPRSYSFVLADNRCGGGERNYFGNMRVFVENGETLEYVALDETAQRFSGAPSDVPTLAQLLARVAEARNAADPDVRLVTDSVDGHPVEIFIDWAPEAIDDEECYEILRYEELDPEAGPSASPG
jgi:hypothetical protein